MDLALAVWVRTLGLLWGREDDDDFNAADDLNWWSPPRDTDLRDNGRERVARAGSTVIPTGQRGTS